VSKYGSFLYGTTTYGDKPLLQYSVEPMTMTILDFTRVYLTWFSPQGSFTRLRLVRNQSGISETAEDGVIVWEDVAGTATTTFTDGEDNPDSLPIVSGKTIFYTFWIFTADLVWTKAGVIAGTVPSDHGLHEKLSLCLPRIYTSAETSPLNEPDRESDLWKFLEGFCFTGEELMTYLDLLRPGDVINYDNVGLVPEPNLPTKNQRALIRDAIQMYSLKGTKRGIEQYCEALTGYAPTATSIGTTSAPKIDIYLEANRANYVRNPSFETLPVAGVWDVTSSNVTQTLSVDMPTDIHAGAHSLSLASTTNAPWSFSVSQDISTPLDPGYNYTFSFYYKSTVPVTVNRHNTFDGTGSDTFDASPSAWTRASVSFVSPIVESTFGDVIQTLAIAASGTTTGSVLLDGVQFEKSYKATEYFDGDLPGVFGVIWGGPSTTSPSYQYFGKEFKMFRLLSTIQNWLPPNMAWQLSTRAGVEVTSG
jgi:hypothetical protein